MTDNQVVAVVVKALWADLIELPAAQAWLYSFAGSIEGLPDWLEQALEAQTRGDLAIALKRYPDLARSEDVERYLLGLIAVHIKQGGHCTVVLSENSIRLLRP